MLDSLCFIILVIILSLILEIRTKQRRRVIVASSGLYVLVLYFALFNAFKDQATLKLLVEIRLDILVDTIQPFFMKLMSYNPFEGNAFFLRILNIIGIKEGTRLYTFITTYRPLSSDSPFSGISVDSTLSFLKNFIIDFFDCQFFDRYALKLKKIAYGYVMILCEGLEKIKFAVLRKNVIYKEYYMIA